jgi:hypothetical protein
MQDGNLHCLEWSELTKLMFLKGYVSNLRKTVRSNHFKFGVLMYLNSASSTDGFLQQARFNVNDFKFSM